MPLAHRERGKSALTEKLYIPVSTGFVVSWPLQAVCRFRGITLEAASAAASKRRLQDRFTFPLPPDAKQKICDIVVQMRRSEHEANFQEALDNAFRAVDPAPHDRAITEVGLPSMQECRTSLTT